MKNLFYLLVLITEIIPISVFPQWVDTFSDENLDQNPTWYGNLEDFTIEANRLRLNTSIAGISMLYTHYELEDSIGIEWQFDLEVAFAPSINNGLKIHLFSGDSLIWTEENSDTLNYYLKIGENGAQDAIELYKEVNGSDNPQLLCRGVEGLVASSFHRKYKILFQNEQWSIFSADANSPYFIAEASFSDDNHSLNNGFFGMTLNYTSSNTGNFYFDNISVQAYFPDTIPPSVDSVIVADDTHLNIYFSEALDSSALQTSNYFITEMLSEPLSVTFANANQRGIVLTVQDTFSPWVEMHLELQNIQDIAGNIASEINLQFQFSPQYEAKVGDLFISEIMADPSPQVGLPNAEFIELYNASDSSLALENYAIFNSGIANYFPSYTLESHSYVVLCKINQVDLFTLDNVLGLGTWTSLLNTGDSLVLKNRNGIRLDHVYYLDDWYDSALKKEGGWSLERIDFSKACYGVSNWKESVDDFGGTPGLQNSRFGEVIDNEVLLKQAILIDSSVIAIAFSGELDTSVFTNIMTSTSPPFTMNWQEASMEENKIILPCDPTFKSGIAYHLTLHNLLSCKGELIPSKQFLFSFSENADPGDIVINEVLFNAFTGGNDFIELYNRSDKFIDLKGWRTNELQDGIVVEDAQISDETLIINPGEIMAFSRDIEELKQNYPLSRSDQLFEVSDLPNFNDEFGKIVLLNSVFINIDSILYSEDMHFELLEDFNGVSLERINPNNKSNEMSSWVSASEKVGFATPGYKNSHFWEAGEYNAQIDIEPQVFTPNNDGENDQLLIHYRLGEGGWQASASIYDKNGLKVKDLLNNDWIAGEGVFLWDGLNNNNEYAGLGIYIVYFEAFNESGKKFIFKEACVIGSLL